MKLAEARSSQQRWRRSLIVQCETVSYKLNDELVAASNRTRRTSLVFEGDNPRFAAAVLAQRGILEKGRLDYVGLLPSPPCSITKHSRCGSTLIKLALIKKRLAVLDFNVDAPADIRPHQRSLSLQTTDGRESLSMITTKHPTRIDRRVVNRSALLVTDDDKHRHKAKHAMSHLDYQWVPLPLGG